MNKEQIEQIVRNLFRQYISEYPNTYNKTGAKGYARDTWDIRDETEVKRDLAAKVKCSDYVRWCIAELELINKNS